MCLVVSEIVITYYRTSKQEATIKDCEYTDPDQWKPVNNSSRDKTGKDQQIIIKIHMALEAISYDSELEKLSILNQLLLPLQSVYEEVNTVDDAWHAIRNMKVLPNLTT